MTKIITKRQKKPKSLDLLLIRYLARFCFAQIENLRSSLRFYKNKKKHVYVMCSFYSIVFKGGVLVWVQNLCLRDRQK